MTNDFALLAEYQHQLASLSTATHMVPLFFIPTFLSTYLLIMIHRSISEAVESLGVGCGAQLQTPQLQLQGGGARSCVLALTRTAESFPMLRGRRGGSERG